MKRQGPKLWCVCFALVLLLCCGCAPQVRFPVDEAAQALVPVSDIGELLDDLDLTSLNLALDTSIRYYERIQGRGSFCFGGCCYQSREMIDALRLFRDIMNSGVALEKRTALIGESFDFYQAAGRDGKGEVLFTGYFEPVLHGSLQETDRFRYPLYRTPDDTVTIRLGLFHERYGNQRLVGRLKGRDVVPYYSRKEIDTDRILHGRGLEIAWVADPVDLFILHVQGSGRIHLPDGGLLRVNYASANGRPYRGLTSYMVKQGYLAEHEKGYRKMKAYLQGHPETRDEIMNYNESYVFFRVMEDGPLGALGLPVVAGRSIATDPAVFPKGALAFVKSRKPVMGADGEVERWLPYKRFVLNQDTGGAIKGAGRLDLFCGAGAEAERVAGSLVEPGHLYFLAPKRTRPSTR